MKRNNLLKNILILCIIFSLAYSFFGKSNSSNTLDDLAYIMAIGIDIGKTNTYQISFQVSTIYSSSSDSSNKESSSGNSSESKTPSFTIRTVECDSIDSGINLIDTYVDKSVDLSHCKLLLVSEDLAKQGISSIIYSLVNKIEIRPDCNLIISSIPDTEFTSDSKPSIQELLPKFYDVTTSTEIESGYTENITLTDFYSDLRCSACEPTAILGTVRNPQKDLTNTSNQLLGIDKAAENVTSTTDDPIIEILGLSVFKNDKLVGNLSGIETVCCLILNNKLENCSVSVPSPFEDNSTIDLSISLSSNPQITVNISNGSPYVVMKGNLDAKILSFNNASTSLNTDLNAELISQIEASTSNYLTNQMYQYLYKTATELNSDISGIGKFARKNFSTLQDWNDYNWLSTYSSSTFNVSLDLSIKSGYLLTNE